MSDDHFDVPDDETPNDKLGRFLGDGKLDDSELEALADGLAEYDSLPPEQRTEQRKVFLSEFYQKTVEIEATSGPIPPPGMLASYEKVLPGSADRILSMAESQLSHRHELENKAIQANIDGEKRGTYFAGVVSLAVVFCSTFLIANGRSVEGLSMILPSLAALVGLFFHEQAAGKKELSEKREQSDSNEIGKG